MTARTHDPNALIVQEPDILERLSFDAARILPTVQVEQDFDGWIVRWHGHPHGGRHFDIVDALDHALRLDESPADQHEGWRAMHGLAA